ncbi:ribosome biogenesis GTPase [Murinocardiopsis flavida]|uniref:Small ribosomal subunit biogenesis GTPase RsgA n=1 Tax=Murinocardiopsis flavida TaxID=645275 RepID=A0A2P8D3P9_9ACTN|nr:ribosome small subunit-dependent GTPase A [Murinocardiopsis flavida]PSK91842.1 ribosome biogenesis GTPase [Murinocardiopsis flavida]
MTAAEHSAPSDRTDFTDLAALGWDPAAAPTADPGSTPLRPARVASVGKGAAAVLAPEPLTVSYGPALRRAAAADPLALPCSGDWVLLRPAEDTAGRAAWTLEEVLPRRTALVRSGVATDSHGQILAANIDTVFVCEPAAPKYNLARVERFLILVWESGAVPVVVLTKCDLTAEPAADLLERVAPAAVGAEVHAVSAAAGTGLDGLAAHLRPGTTLAMLGSSGAGKSTLVNALAGARIMDTGEVRDDGRGRHTTTRRELVPLPQGAVMLDTPGVRRIGLGGSGDGVERAFADLLEFAELCRFRDCVHESEPGCAVLAAVESGDLPERRLHSWRKLQREAEWNAARTDHRVRQERARKWKTIHKEMRRSGRNRP